MANIPFDKSAPAPAPIGPTTIKVTGAMIINENKGVKILRIDSGKIRFKKRLYIRHQPNG
ncbi:hypothetical protein Q757_09450 [Oenococcus alcoholitolerans]|uniref:Uncharacterized protein n=1 Tax=Oenococcus alcoholitolerans TaxID=931074 RepID=A0ABR4XPC8_9LACO|nr:hypothetical protein Q757_09450 [Oenococcus alcoholitolerans]